MRSFIIMVTILDVTYALVNFDSFSIWEANPLARWLGAPLVITLRIISTGLFLALAWKIRWALVFVSIVHMALLFQYFRILG